MSLTTHFRMHRGTARTSRDRVTAVLATAGIVSGLAVITGAGSTAGAATASTTRSPAPTAPTAPTAKGSSLTATTSATAPEVARFCAQLRRSTTTISAISPTAADLNTRVAAEWTRLEQFAPVALKGDVTKIRVAYELAAKQPATAKATLAAITPSAQKVSSFAAASCPASDATRGAGAGPGGGQFGEARACLEAAGVSLPGRGGRVGSGSTPVATIDAKTRAAYEKCGVDPNGFAGGRGQGGARGQSPEVIACLAKRGVTLPTRVAGSQPGSGAGTGSRPTPATFTATQQAAIDACRNAAGTATTVVRVTATTRR